MPYVMMKYFGGKSCQATYPQGISLLYIISLIIIKQLHTQQKQHGHSTSNMKDFTRETS